MTRRGQNRRDTFIDLLFLLFLYSSIFLLATMLLHNILYPIL